MNPEPYKCQRSTKDELKSWWLSVSLCPALYIVIAEHLQRTLKWAKVTELRLKDCDKDLGRTMAPLRSQNQALRKSDFKGHARFSETLLRSRREF